MRVLTASALVLLLGALGTGILVQQHLVGQLGRIDNAFSGLEGRPARPATGPGANAVNILLVTTDRGQADAPPDWAGLQPDDAIMVLHLGGDRRGGSVISLPRGARVPGHGGQTLGAAFSMAGPAGAVHAVEELTHLRIDHLALLSRQGLRELTDADGGVRIDVAGTVRDPARGITWTAGPHTLDGDEALAFVSQRDGLPGGEPARVRREQSLLRTLMDDSLHQEMRKNPLLLYRFLDTITRNLSVESGWSTGDLRGLLISLRNLRSGAVSYLQSPLHRPGETGDTSLWLAVREDAVDGWLRAHPSAATPMVVS